MITEAIGESEKKVQIKYSKKELKDCAMNYAKFLYDLWQKNLENEIMKEDKTIDKKEEPTDTN